MVNCPYIRINTVRYDKCGATLRVLQIELRVIDEA